MVPPAPGRLSITTGWPSDVFRRSPNNRISVSAPCPGGNGTTSLSGCEGNGCALDTPVANAINDASKQCFQAYILSPDRDDCGTPIDPVPADRKMVAASRENIVANSSRQ